MLQKLDAGLRAQLRAHHAGRPIRTKAPASGLVELFVTFTGNLADLEALGFVSDSLVENPATGRKIATGTIPIDRLEDLAAIPHLRRASYPKPVEPELNYSLGEIRGTAVHTGPPSYKGRGVVIGIIDSGVDWRHGSFIDFDDRSSRILEFWDQIKKAEAGETKGPGPAGAEGVVYTQEQLSRGIQGTETIRTGDWGRGGKDKESKGHGSHVAGIAAGNGGPASCCSGPYTYVGVAPLAELIVVRRGPDDTDIQRAMEYIFTHTKAAGRPVVINLSFGRNIGPHDGTEEWEETIDTLVRAAPRRVVVKSAGNEAALRSHVMGTVPPAVGGVNGSLQIDFTIADTSEYSSVLDLWYDRIRSLTIEVIPVGGTPTGPIPHGTDFPVPPAPLFYANPTATARRQVQVSVDATINDPDGRDNNFRVYIHKPTSGNISIKEWRLRLTNAGAAAVNFHCWSSPQLGTLFLPPLSPGDPPDGRVRASSQSTITSPGNAREVITVANHEARTSVCDCWPSTGIVPSSSRGPLARQPAPPPAPRIEKPDIAAPGLEITSASADAANLKGNCCDCCPDTCCCLYVPKSGTSMAAPHVAGAIALMLERNATLTKAEILTALQDGARDRPTAPGQRNDVFGAGKLDIQKALTKIAAGPAPPPPGPPAPPYYSLDIDRPLWNPGKGVWNPGKGAARRTPEMPDSPLPALPAGIRILRARMTAFPEGELIAAVISRHFSEVRRLINTNPRIATMWHRAQGPRLLQRLIRGAIDSGAPAAIPSEAERRYIDRWCDLLARYGSAALNASLARYRSAVIDLLRVPLAARVEALAVSR